MVWRIYSMSDEDLMKNFGLTYNFETGDLISSVYPSCCVYNANSLSEALIEWKQLFIRRY